MNKYFERIAGVGDGEKALIKKITQIKQNIYFLKMN